jgi:hypothetical protein
MGSSGPGHSNAVGMKVSSKWHVLYNGTGSVTGNDWIEEVCYLGEEKWLLSLRDDAAWSMYDVDVQEPEERSSADLAAWVEDMDSTDGGETYQRVESLLEISTEVGAGECAALLQQFLQSRESDA